MKLLFSTRPAYGHMYPLMPLAEAARAAGHEVVFATCGEFVPKLERLGYRTETVGISIDDGLEQFMAAGGTLAGSDGQRTNLDAAGEIFVSIVGRRTAKDLLPVLRRERPDIVVYEQYEFGAPVAAGVAGIEAICLGISPQLPLDARRRVLGPRVERLWAEHGVADAPFDVATGNVYLDIFPSAMQEPSFTSDPARIPMQPIPWAEPGFDVPAWVTLSERPVIYLTLGTVVATDEVLRPAIDGLASLDAEVLVTLGSAAGAELGPLPANVRVETFVDQARLMPYVDLVVHHGGSGTVLGALVNGVPQVLTPRGADQFLNGDIVARAGLAEVLLPGEATAEAVAAAAQRALTEPNRSAIDAARDEIAGLPTPVDVMARIGRRAAA
jgi:UDP:flavonoid glycosyltransferase YjiC (YdhE family)